MKELLATDDFKPNSAMVVLDFLIRHSFIEPDSGAELQHLKAELRAAQISFNELCVSFCRAVLSGVCGRSPSHIIDAVHMKPSAGVETLDSLRWSSPLFSGCSQSVKFFFFEAGFAVVGWTTGDGGCVLLYSA